MSQKESFNSSSSIFFIWNFKTLLRNIRIHHTFFIMRTITKLKRNTPHITYNIEVSAGLSKYDPLYKLLTKSVCTQQSPNYELIERRSYTSVRPAWFVIKLATVPERIMRLMYWLWSFCLNESWRSLLGFACELTINGGFDSRLVGGITSQEHEKENRYLLYQYNFFSFMNF